MRVAQRCRENKDEGGWGPAAARAEAADAAHVRGVLAAGGYPRFDFSGPSLKPLIWPSARLVREARR